MNNTLRFFHSVLVWLVVSVWTTGCMDKVTVTDLSSLLPDAQVTDGNQDDGDGADGDASDGGLDADSDGGSDPSLSDQDPVHCVRYVNHQSMVNVPDGLSWETAYRLVQAGIDAAALLGHCEVWVAKGDYAVYRVSAFDTVELKQQVEVYGGFIGTETSRNQRDWHTNITTLDGQGSVHHVVTANDSPVLDGFVITGGFADEVVSEHDKGGGLVNIQASTNILNCTFIQNYAGSGGGAIHNRTGTVVVKDCIFRENYAGLQGGAIFNEGSSIFQDCTFERNTADWLGGAIYHASGMLELQNAVLLKNGSGALGGAVFMEHGIARFVNCSFADNRAAHQGGALYGDSPSITTFLNCILWADSPNEINAEYADFVSVSYSDIQGGIQGNGNLALDPKWVDMISGDLHLSAGSPCIDAANGRRAPAFDREGKGRIDDPLTGNTGIGILDFVDMGAFEYSP